MKKALLLTILLFKLSFVFGQTPDWGSWTPISCFSSLSFSVLGNGYVQSISEYSWQVRIKSSYSKKVTFNMTWIVGGERLSIGQVTLSPGESYGHTPRYFKSSSNNIYVEVDKVCFEGQDCYKNGYADCSGNQVLKTTSNSTNQTPNSNTSPNQQNDLTDYNRSKADLERQMQQKNQEIANQNAEAQKTKGVAKEYSGTPEINFNFKNIFNYLNENTDLTTIQQLFLNSGFKLCSNCFQSSDKVSLAKNNEVLEISLKKLSPSQINISISSCSNCPSIQNTLKQWVTVSELEFFKSNEYGSKYIYNDKFMLSIIPLNNPNQWVFQLAESFDLSEFRRLKKVAPLNNNSAIIPKTEDIISVQKQNSTNQNSKVNYSIGKELTKNLGKMENGRDYLHFFELPKNVKTATASCGCVSTEISKENSNQVLATFHGIPNYKGPIRKSILVTYEDGTAETLYISGEL